MMTRDIRTLFTIAASAFVKSGGAVLDRDPGAGEAVFAAGAPSMVAEEQNNNRRATRLMVAKGVHRGRR